MGQWVSEWYVVSGVMLSHLRALQACFYFTFSLLKTLEFKTEEVLAKRCSYVGKQFSIEEQNLFQVLFPDHKNICSRFAFNQTRCSITLLPEFNIWCPLALTQICPKETERLRSHMLIIYLLSHCSVVFLLAFLDWPFIGIHNPLLSLRLHIACYKGGIEKAQQLLQ